MGFNLKEILKSLLFSTSEPLTIKDVQAVISRYHQEQEFLLKKKQRDDADSVSDSLDAAARSDADENPQDAEQTLIDDIIAQVPTLLTATQIREAMEEIAGELDERGEVYRLVQSSSGFKLVISKNYAEWVRLLRNDPRPQRLTRAALETLAIIAYRQPVTRAEIEAIRGVNADSAITRLTEKELIFISGRADLPGRPIQYSTTRNFLDYVGVNSIEELPASDVLSPNQISEWIRRASNPQDIKDSDVGLPSEHIDEVQALEYKEQVSREIESQDSEDKKIESEFHEEPREEDLEVGADHFPSVGAESAGSEEEFEPTPDNNNADHYNEAEK